MTQNLVRPSRIGLAFVLSCLLAGTISSAIHAAGTLPGLHAGPVVLSRAANDLAEASAVRTMADGRHRVWVYFRDKAVTNEQSYRQAAAEVTLTARAAARRRLAGYEEVQFLDLPVVESYVSRITATGAALRNRSRWLNAVSVDATDAQLSAIRALPEVLSISSVVGYRGSRDTLATEPLPRPENIARSLSLSYGSSFAQLDQLKVPVAHDLGYNGQGVVLALFDTGFRTGHEAFSAALNGGRIIATHDFIFGDNVVDNQPNDDATAWNHGTFTLSTAAGEKSGTLYGPAYGATLILCKTEDVRSETPVEEDNWVAALEYSDSIGVNVISSSLGYVDWYTYANFDGLQATITKAANTAAALGIVVCNAMGNSGPGAGTLNAPADAFNILSVGSVTSLGGVSSFSSRGPTFDGRTKPEVCARGSSTFCASYTSTTAYTSVSGTSLSTPLVAGVACQLIQARPGFTALQIRQALMESASNASTPDNNIGWGIVNIEKALDWGLDLTSNVSSGNAPLTVNFTASSPLSPTSYLWNFGDGGTATVANPSHQFLTSGNFTVTCTITSPYGTLVDTVAPGIVVVQNQLSIEHDSTYAGHPSSMALTLSTPVVLTSLNVPLVIAPGVHATLTAVNRTNVTTLFDTVAFIASHPGTGQYVVRFKARPGGNFPVGNYDIANITYLVDSFDLGGLTSNVDATPVDGYVLSGSGPGGTSTPSVGIGSIGTKWVTRGNSDNSTDQQIDIADLTKLVDFLFISFAPPITIQSGDCDGDHSIDIGDLTRMVDFLFLGGPAFPNP